MYWQPVSAMLCVSIMLHHHMSVNKGSTEHQQSINTASTECQQSVDDFEYSIMYTPRALSRHIPKSKVLAAVMNKSDRNMVTAPVRKWESTERQQFCVLHLVYSKDCCKTCINNWSIDSLYRQYCVCRYCYSSKWAWTEHQQSVNRASTQCQQSVNRVLTLLGVVSCIIQGLCYGI